MTRPSTSSADPLLAPSGATHETNYVTFVASKFGLDKASALVRAGVGFTLAAVLVLILREAWIADNRMNVILMLSNHPSNHPGFCAKVSDGFGPASETLARNYNAHVNGFGASAVLPLDSILVGASRTRSSDSFVTDSAAGATAFACALKTYNGAIGVDPDQRPCGSVLEAAKLHGYLTGHVSTSRVTHATPASFTSHVIDRDMEDEIAMQQIGNYTLGRMADVIFGGGSCHFKPQSAGPAESCRLDDMNLLELGTSQYGWNVIENVDKFRGEVLKLPVLGLFTADHMSYEIDRNAKKEPSLKEMALKALHLLNEGSKKKRRGFFIMIEGSRIDMAAHTNDPAAHVREILAYNEAIAAVIDWVNTHPNTVMISVSDHETGGLSVAHQLNGSYPVYNWYPEVLLPVQNSAEFLASILAAYPDKEDIAAFTQYVQNMIETKLGVHDATPVEVDRVVRGDFAYGLSQIVSDRAGLGWATHGHSAVDVNLYAHGHKSGELRGNHENTDIGKFIERTMGIDLSTVTAKLLGGSGKAWWDRVIDGFKVRSNMKKSDKKGQSNPATGNTSSAFAEIHYHKGGNLV
ncbi:alkaline-phosphatase-like protein [Chytriomyces sp. MP71]|nr:alkaline-phosphatase-like protein [Chytriomyces sp. MP71]